MFVSCSHRIAFAHYPKTAGNSLQRWFLDTFKDASPLVPENPHLSVASGLALMSGGKWQRRLARWRDHGLRLVAPSLAEACGPWHSSLRIFGVMREPFEMLVSLYEYWRRRAFAEEPTAAFIRLARDGEFPDFLAAAVVDGHMLPYDVFFDVGGPLWPRTTLLDFASLEPALHQFCTNLGLTATQPLPRLNRAPEGQRNIDRYREQAGPLMPALRRHFRWYYEEGVHLAIRGAPSALRAA